MYQNKENGSNTRGSTSSNISLRDDAVSNSNIRKPSKNVNGEEWVSWKNFCPEEMVRLPQKAEQKIGKVERGCPFGRPLFGTWMAAVLIYAFL